MKKIFALLMAVVMLFCMFSVTAGAAKMTKEEVVEFYHSVLEKTAKKYKVLYVKDVWKTRDTADFSPLSGKDLEKTMEEYSFCDGQWTVSEDDVYLSGVRKKSEKVKETELYYWFEINDSIDYYYTLKSAKYENNKITINLSADDSAAKGTKKVVAELTSKNELKKITTTTKDSWGEYSVREEVPFRITSEYVETYTFVYDKIPAKSLELSAYEVNLGYRDIEEITYTVGPENATYKGVYVETLMYDDFAEEWVDSFGVAYAWEEDGTIYIEGIEEGRVKVNVRTYSGDILKSCEVTVRFGFFDRISYFFYEMLAYFEYIFTHIALGVVI